MFFLIGGDQTVQAYSIISLTISYLIANTVRGKILEGENFGESLLMKQMARKILANLLADLQLFHCIYNYWRGKFWRFVYHSPNSRKFSPSKFFPRTVSLTFGGHDLIFLCKNAFIELAL